MKKLLLIFSLAISVLLFTVFIALFIPATRTVDPVKEGFLAGSVSIGPICPVEREGVPCPVPPEAYAARMILVYLPGHKTLYGVASIRSDGTYEIALPVGEYVVDLQKNGIDRSADVPANVVIQEGKITTLDINIDTGIR